MHTIAILYNNKAGRHRAGAIAGRLSAQLQHRNIIHRVFGEHWPTDYAEFSAVWIIGGDGTLNFFINHAKGPIPPLALFKGGTGNDFAGLLYGDLGNEAIMEKVLASTARAVDAGVCNGRFFVNICGIGFDGDVLKRMRAIRWLGGFWGYYASIVVSIFSFRAPVYTIIADEGRPLRKNLLLVMVSNASHTGGGFHVSPGAMIDDGKLDLVTADELSIFQRLRALTLVRKGKHLDLPFVHKCHANKLEIIPEKEVFAQLDGEMISADRFIISILPGHLRFLY